MEDAMPQPGSGCASDGGELDGWMMASTVYNQTNGHVS